MKKTAFHFMAASLIVSNILSLTNNVLVASAAEGPKEQYIKEAMTAYLADTDIF